MAKKWQSTYCVEGVMDFQDDFEDALNVILPDDWPHRYGSIRITVEWVEEDTLPCGHNAASLGGFGGCNPNGTCMECEKNG
jgi:hypothetical protein